VNEKLAGFEPCRTHMLPPFALQLGGVDNLKDAELATRAFDLVEDADDTGPGVEPTPWEDLLDKRIAVLHACRSHETTRSEVRELPDQPR
jgi:hypothetical protein